MTCSNIKVDKRDNLHQWVGVCGVLYYFLFYWTSSAILFGPKFLHPFLLSFLLLSFLPSFFYHLFFCLFIYLFISLWMFFLSSYSYSACQLLVLRSTCVSSYLDCPCQPHFDRLSSVLLLYLSFSFSFSLSLSIYIHLSLPLFHYHPLYLYLSPPLFLAFEDLKTLKREQEEAASNKLKKDRQAKILADNERSNCNAGKAGRV